MKQLLKSALNSKYKMKCALHIAVIICGITSTTASRVDCIQNAKIEMLPFRITVVNSLLHEIFVSSSHQLYFR